MKKTLRALRNWTLAVAFLPLLWAVTKHTVLLVPIVGSQGWKSWWTYALGALTYIIVDFFIAKPMWLYVFGHELTHAISGLATGAKIHSFKACSGSYARRKFSFSLVVECVLRFGAKTPNKTQTAQESRNRVLMRE
jgi:hypothetical protein